MKYVFLIVFPLLVLGGLFVYLKEVNHNPTQIVNSEKKPLAFKDNIVQCKECFMFLVDKKHTVQMVNQEGKTAFFDDIGCLILWAKKKNIDLSSMVIWVYSNDTQTYVDAQKAYYTTSGETPMHYGFGAYENPQEGFIDFEQMRLSMLRGENMSNPKLRR